MARFFDGHRVSEAWFHVLTAARRDGVHFVLNSGQRTMAEQQHLYGLYRAGKGNLAAKPSPTAPHIRVGRQDHALDVRWDDGGRERLQRWLRSKGVETALTVPGEPWHVEAISTAALLAAGERLRPPRFTALERRLLAAPRTRANRLALRAQARAIRLAAARPRGLGGGWDRLDRKRRRSGLLRAARS
jgi:hypothetical protein